MNRFAKDINQIANDLHGTGKDHQTMTAGHIGAGTSTTRSATQPKRGARISRQRWLRLIAAVAGVMLLVMQTVPALAVNSSLDDLNYRLGKEQHAYGLELSSLNDDATRASGDLDASDGASSNNRFDILRGAVDKMRESQQDAEASAGSTNDDVGEVFAQSDSQSADHSEVAQQASIDPVVQDDFTSSADTVVWTGEVDYVRATVDEANGGWYVMQVQGGSMVPAIASGNLQIADGAIMASAAIVGENHGDVGIFGRSISEATNLYYCYADSKGGAGCQLLQDGEWHSLLRLDPGSVARYEIDNLYLEIHGSTLNFWVNETHVGSYTDTAMIGGSWGVATACYDSQCTGVFDYVEIYDDSGAAGDQGVSIVYETDFSNVNPEEWIVGQGDWGAGAIENGWYRVAPSEGWSFANPIFPAGVVDDSVVSADIAIQGSGISGLVSRLSLNDQDQFSYYVCWVNSAGFANCSLVMDDNWHQLSGSTGMQVELADVNRLSMSVVGDRLSFSVNGQMVVDVQDGNLSSGMVGFFHEAFSGSEPRFENAIDYVKVEEPGSNFQTVLASEMDANDLSLYVGNGDFGSIGYIDGWYGTQLNAGWNFPMFIDGSFEIQDGAMGAVVNLQGDGAFGLIARAQQTDAGLSFYTCWITPAGDAACSLAVNGEWTLLGMSEAQIALEEVNHVSIGVFESEIYFAINGEIIVSVVDDTLSSGSWGFYNEAFSDGAGFVSFVDSVTIDQYNG